MGPCRQFVPTLDSTLPAFTHVCVKFVRLVSWLPHMHKKLTLTFVTVMRVLFPQSSMLNPGQNRLNELSQTFGVRNTAGTSAEYCRGRLYCIPWILERAS